MTEQEILNLQEQNGNREYYLMLVGKFLHAYGHGAFALSRVSGYRVIRKQRKGGEVLTCGFPIENLDLVRQRMLDGGGLLESIDSKTFLFRGVDGTPDSKMVYDPSPSPSPKRDGDKRESWLEEAVRGYNLSMSTPMDAMIFIGTLQKRLKETEQHDNACESPAG